MEWDIWSGYLIATKLTLYISCALAVGSALFLIAVKPQTPSLISTLKRVSILCSGIALVSTILFIFLQSGQLMDEGIAGMFDLDILKLLIKGPIRNSSICRTTALLLLIFSLKQPQPKPLLIIGSAFLVSLSFALIGHTSDKLEILSLLIAVHFLAASFWVGALLPLYKISDPMKPNDECPKLANRFGKQASIAVPILLIEGLICAYALIGSFGALFNTDYGQLMVTKILVVGALLIFAALNKLHIVPSLDKNYQSAARALRISISFEAVAFFIIFTLTALLTSAVELP